MYTDDPLRDFDDNEERLAKMLAKRPVCACCGEPIQTEHYYDIPNVGLWCEHCIEDVRGWTEDWR